MPARVFIEGTATYIDGQVGGIHRVVRKIVQEMPALHDAFDVECAPVVLKGGGLRDARPLIRANARSSRRPPALLRARDWTAARLAPRDEFAWTDTDLLLLLDASWGKRIWPAVRRAKRQGAAVGVMIHDLIPINYPQFFPAKLPKMFRVWLDGAIEHADFFIGNSRTTIGDVEHHVQRQVRERGGHGRWSGDRFDSFWLGADLPSTTRGGPVRETVRSFFADRRAPYLMVSTIEPRKNHTYLLDAFERVWRKSPETRLCIVGKIGWRCEDVVARIRGHRLLGKSLMLFGDLNDAELQFCYQQAGGFVFPSIVEGFGLPIVEALNNGLRVLASDTPIHREVGGDHCRYFDLDDDRSLTAMILQSERGQSADAHKPYHGVTWEESCRELLTKSLRMAGAVNRVASRRAA